MKQETDEISRLWRNIVSWKTTAGLVTCIVLVYLVTLPFLTTPLYESEAIVYVPLVIPNQQINQQGVGFAGEHEIDSYIQILKSNTLTDSLVKRFGADKRGFRKKLQSRITIEKTRYGSVSVKVRDPDPEQAAALANSIIGLGESIRQSLLYPNRQEAMLYSRSLYEQKALEVSALENSIDSLNKKGLHKPNGKDFDYEKALMAYKLEFQELISRKNQYERAKKDFDTPLPKVYVVSRAVTGELPVWPKRGLLCLAAVFVYLFLLIVVAIIKREFSQRTS